MIEHMRKMRRYKDYDRGEQETPRIIDRFGLDRDASGVIGSFQPNGATITSNNAFFKTWDQWQNLLHLPSAAKRLDYRAK